MAVPKVNLRERKNGKKITYFIDFAVNGKRIRYAVGTNKKTAQEIQFQKQIELSLGHHNLPQSINQIISLEDLSKNFIASKRNRIRPSSLKRYKNYLDKFIECMNKFLPGPSQNVSEMRTIHLDEIFNHLLETEITNGKSWQPKTVNCLRTVIIQLLNYGIKQGQISSNPAKETKSFPQKSKKLFEYFSDDELDMIWKQLDNDWAESFKFIVHTGLRKDEFINLLWQNVSLDEASPSVSITSSDEWQTKTGESRVIPLTDVALEILKKRKGSNSKYVFPAVNGSKWHPDKPYRILKKALKKLGLQGNIHKLRHTFASKLAMKGAPIFDIQKLLGHSDIKSTMIYAHLSPGYLRDSIQRLEE